MSFLFSLLAKNYLLFSNYNFINTSFASGNTMSFISSSQNGTYYDSQQMTDQDPALLLVCADKPTMPLTIYETQNHEQIRLPVGLSEISEGSLPYQLFHTYYEGFSFNFYLQWNGNRKVRILPEGDYLQAKRNYTGIQTGMTAHAITNSDFIKIVSGGKCLEASETKSRYREAYPLQFRACADKRSQKFKFISKQKAFCKLKMKECPGTQLELFGAEELIKQRVDHFLQYR